MVVENVVILVMAILKDQKDEKGLMMEEEVPYPLIMHRTELIKISSRSRIGKRARIA